MTAAAWSEITANGLWPARRLAGGLEGPNREPPPEDEIAVCAAWIRAFAVRTKTIQRKRSSYSYKHSVEDWTDGSRRYNRSGDPLEGTGLEWTDGYRYVCNGAFIEAARRAGYRIDPTDDGSPNAFLDFRSTYETCLRRQESARRVAEKKEAEASWRRRVAESKARWAAERAAQDRSDADAVISEALVLRAIRMSVSSPGPVSTVYMIQRESGGPIKIGVTMNLGKRISSLQTGSDTVLTALATLPGDRKLERAMHLRFADDRRQGEWFEPSAALLEFIASIARIGA